MEIRNTSPLGDLDVTLLGRVVMAREVIDVTEEQAVELCSALASFAPVAGEDLAAVLLGRGDDCTRTYLAECAQVSVEELLAAPAEVLAAGRVHASGTRADLSGLVPLRGGGALRDAAQ